VTDRKRRILWHGLLVVLLSLAAGGFMQSYANPRLGLSAHVGGIMTGTFILAVGAVWDELRLGSRAATALFWLGIYSAYVNPLGLQLAAAFGTSATTPMLGAGHAGTPWQEAVVGFCLVSGAVAILAFCVLALAGLRARRS
jgi:hydroxylaminobenzene mutase